MLVYFKSPNLKYTIFVYLAVIVYGFAEMSKSVNFPLIKDDFGYSYQTQGLILTTTGLTFVLTTANSSIFLKYLKFKATLFIGYFLATVGNIVSGVTPKLWVVLFGIYIQYLGYGLIEIGMNCFLSSYFNKNAGTMISVYHGMYGIGAIIGPTVAGSIARNYLLSYRLFYLICGGLYFLVLLYCIFLDLNSFYNTDSTSDDAITLTNIEAIKDPLIILLIITVGVQVNVEKSAASWAVLYIQDVLKLSATTDGSLFMTIFYICFTISRLFFGPIYERIGFLPTLQVSSIGAMILFIIGFSTGVMGRFFLMGTGFFVAMFFPSVACIIIQMYGKNAPVATSVVISLQGLLNYLIGYLQGLINEYIGPAWGYRSATFISLVVSILVCFVTRIVNKRKIKKEQQDLISVANVKVAVVEEKSDFDNLENPDIRYSGTHPYV